MLCTHVKLQIGARGATMPLNVTTSKYTKQEHQIFYHCKIITFQLIFLLTSIAASLTVDVNSPRAQCYATIQGSAPLHSPVLHLQVVRPIKSADFAPTRLDWIGYLKLPGANLLELEQNPPI